MSITQKILSAIILIVIVMITIMPTVNAVTNEVLTNGTEEEILYQQKDNNSNKPTNFEVLLACALKGGDMSENEFKLSDISSIILQKPTKEGLYIAENSREYVLNLINKFTNKIYKVDGCGFLVEDVESLKEDIKTEYENYTKEIDEIITQKKTIVLSMLNNYYKIDDMGDELLKESIKDTEYTLNFENSNEQIIILNKSKYDTNIIDLKDTKLLEEFLGIFNKEKIMKNNEKDNKEEKDNEKNNEKEIIDDNAKVNPQIRELLEAANIEDVTTLSTKVTENQMQLLKARLKNIYNLYTNETEGIFIENTSKDVILRFLNNHSSYTYALDLDNHLNCDKKLKINERFDFLEPEETEMDIGIQDALQDNKKIIILISDKYFKFDNNNITEIQFSNDIYSKAYENNNLRIIVLNSLYYNNNIDFDLPLSDDFIKILNDVQYKVLIGDINFTNEKIYKNNDDHKEPENPTRFTDNGQALGIANQSQTVYAGPNNNGSYVSVGSISNQEVISILGAEGNYYHILYEVNNSNNEKTGYVLKSNVTVMALIYISDEIMTGGYRHANTGVSIQSRGLYSVAVPYGSVSNTEGVTLLYDYNINYNGESYQVGFVEFWTSSGMKRGYVKMQYLTNPFTTTLAKASSTKTTYTGPDSSTFTAGTGAIGANEYVCVLGYTGDYIYIEYNTNSGRRRAFCNKTDLGISDPSSLGVTQLPAIQMTQGYISSQSNNVSAGPGAAYSLCAYVGAIGQYESVFRQSTSGTNPYNQLDYTYIVYHAGNSLKGGFVPSSILTVGQNPSIPNVPSSVGLTGGFQEDYSWQTGLGGPIKSYKLGTGNKRLYLVFAQHGFEDEGYGDGVELVNIAYDFMDYMYNNRNNSDFQNILSNWTIYVVPYVNRDGITSGSSERGPGRCTVVGEIDLNRNWPTTTYVQCLDDPKNYTGTTQLGTVEGQGLYNFLMSNDVKPVNGSNSILIDIHGWDCETIGNLAVGGYYVDEFKNDATTSFLSHSLSHSFSPRQLYAGTGSSGYLAQWAVENGIGKSIILEMPSHTNRVTGGRSLSERFCDATKTLLDTE